jgi:hypothetical protein
VSELDFHIDYFIEVPDVKEDFIEEISEGLHSLAEGHDDFIGASVTVEEIAGVEDPFIYQARMVAYIRPENIAVIAKRETSETALKEALSTLEDRIREERRTRQQVWKRPNLSTDISLYDLTSKEVYDTYFDQVSPQEILQRGRTQIAANLMVNEKLEQESAYYATDLVLEHAQRLINNQP